MSEKPSALSTIPPQPPAEGEYGVICATVAESARGRWFLDEYARRNRNADTVLVLAAIERIEAVIRGERDQQAYQSFRGDLLDMAKAIAQTRAEVAGIKPDVPAPGTAAVADAPTAPAIPDIFAAAERLQDVAWTMRERGLDPRICQQIEALASSILLASSLRNPDDHRTHKLGEVLHFLERRINAMLDACAEPVPASTDQASIDDASTDLASTDLASTDLASTDLASTDLASTDEASTDQAWTYQASPDEEVEAASDPLRGGNGHDAGGSYAVVSPDQEAQAAEAPALPQASDTEATFEPSSPAPIASVPIAEAPTVEEPALIRSDVSESEPALPAGPPPTLQATGQATEEAAAKAATEDPAAPVETEPRHDPAPAPSTTARTVIPQLEIEPLVVVPVGWRKTATDAPPAQLEHAPIAVEPLFPERSAEASAPAAVPSERQATPIESAPAAPPSVEMATPVAADPAQHAEPTPDAIFKPPEAVVFLVEYPVPAASEVAAEPQSGSPASEPEPQAPPSRVETPTPSMSAAEPGDFLLEPLQPPAAWCVPTLPAPIAAPAPSVERSPDMTTEIEKQPIVPAPAETDGPALQSHALPPAEPIPQPPAAPVAAPPAAAQVMPAPSDPLAALKAMSPEERIALFT